MPLWSNRGIKVVSAALLIWVGGASAPAGSPASTPVGPQAPLVRF
jgi:hypothetical protein